MADSRTEPPRRAVGLIGSHEPLLPAGGSGLDGVDEQTWLDVIHKMDEVYSQLVHDEIALEEKNAELERSYQALSEAHEALKRTQQQLLHAEKMASLGRLVAGVAHELNNPISFVLGNVHALQRYTERLQTYLGAVHGGATADELDHARRRLRIDHLLADLPSLMAGTLEGAQRTADIVNGLKRFSAVDREERVEVELADVIERAIHWVRKGTAPAFVVDFEPQAGCTVRGSPGQLLQVMMNLVQNAYDAAAGRSDPALHISLRPDPHDPAWVEIRFRDNGPGIAPEHLARIFEPFFTTKAVGKGTGLGLSISYGIVERHGGQLLAGNPAQGGAELVVRLPVGAAGEGMACPVPPGP
jgi:two-component system, NtrC family, sensor histidine kinase HupT/HoxJ